ncbi:MAG TPA: hypothetical protein VII28_13615 [Puia sp.]
MNYSSSSETMESEQKKPCHDSDTPTKKTIWTRKNAYCLTLKSNVGVLRQCEETKAGNKKTYEHKNCRFVKTEKYYRLFRNLELQYGVELIRASGDIENNIKALVTDNKTLADALTDLLATIKTAKSAFGDLRDSACKLDACSKDSCNRSQMAILTGQKLEDCDDKHKPDPGKRPPDCEHAGSILHQLIHEPPSLSKEIDIILNASADVIGIQTFSNIGSLSTQFFPSVKASAKAFDDFIQDRMNKGNADLTTAQAALAQAIKDLTDSEFALFTARISVNSIKGLKEFLCHHKCECICEGDKRLDKCKCEICEICQEVAKIYSRETEDKQPAAVPA